MLELLCVGACLLGEGFITPGRSTPRDEGGPENDKRSALVTV